MKNQMNIWRKEGKRVGEDSSDFITRKKYISNWVIKNHNEINLRC